MLRLGLLTCNAESYSSRRLYEAALARGHRTRLLDTLRFSLLVSEARPELYYRDERLGRLDAAIPRIGVSVTTLGLAVVRQLEQLGVFTTSPAHAIEACRDKLRSTQILGAHGLPVPKTAFVRDRDGILPAIERVGGAPVIIKLLEGAQGIGVMLADTTEAAEAIVQALQSARQHVLIQRFVHESRGRDVRAFVVAGRVVAAMSRRAAGREFRSNVHRGGRGERVELDDEFERCAARAASVLGLGVAGVDMLEGRDGPVVLEVNASPGLEGIEHTTGVDVASAILEYVETAVAERRGSRAIPAAM
jgi:ribosomal protein S6--L-glutamate ligase